MLAAHNDTAPIQTEQTPQHAKKIQELRDQIQSLTQELSYTKAMVQPNTCQQPSSVPAALQPQASTTTEYAAPSAVKLIRFYSSTARLLLVTARTQLPVDNPIQ